MHMMFQRGLKVLFPYITTSINITKNDDSCEELDIMFYEIEYYFVVTHSDYVCALKLVNSRIQNINQKL